MTLIATALSEDAVIQVSDRRLTRNGAVCKEPATKAICISCTDANFALAYTGLAEIAGTRTDDWLVNFLLSIKAAEMGFLEIREALMEQAGRTFKTLHNLGRGRDITFVFAGFGPAEPFAALLSNIEDCQGNWLSSIDDEFRCGLFLRNQKPMRKLDLIINGREDAVAKPIRAAIPKIRKHYLRRSFEDRVKILVQLIRSAADDPSLGHYIGKDCISVVISRTGNFIARYHPIGSQPVQHAPHLISRGIAVKNLWFSTSR